MIDISRLQRDYSKKPIFISKNGKNSERLSKDELYYLYVECNLTRVEIADFCGVSKSNVERWIRLYAIKKDRTLVQESVEKQFIQKYGAKTPLQNQFVKEKIARTKLEKYGDSAFNNIIKTSKTKLEKYGTSTFNNRVKNKETCLKKYGVNNVKQINQQYFVILHNKSKLEQFLIDNDCHNGYKMAELLHISYSTLRQYIQKYELKHLYNIIHSQFELDVREYFRKYNVIFNYHIGHKEFDIYFPDFNFAIECNGNWWHSTEKRTSEMYHYEKSKLGIRNNIFVYHLWEYDWDKNRKECVNNIENHLTGEYEKQLASNVVKLLKNKEQIYLEQNIDHEPCFSILKKYGYEAKLVKYRKPKFVYYKSSVVSNQEISQNKIYDCGKFVWKITKGLT